MLTVWMKLKNVLLDLLVVEKGNKPSLCLAELSSNMKNICSKINRMILAPYCFIRIVFSFELCFWLLLSNGVCRKNALIILAQCLL